MNQLNSLIVASGMLLSLSLAVGPAIAADTTTNKDEPTAQDIKNSKERGMIVFPSVAPTAGGMNREVKAVPAPDSDKESNFKNLKQAKPMTITNGKATGAKKAVVNSAKSNPAKKATTAAASAATPNPVVKKEQPISRPVVANSQSSTGAIPVSFTDAGDRIIKAWLNKTGPSPHYRDGEKIQINVAAARDCNLMIFDFDGKGKLTQIFPNQYQPSSTLRAGETVAIGGTESMFDFAASLPSGLRTSKEHVFVYAYPTDKESPISVAMGTVQDSPFRSGDMTIEEYRKLVNQSKVFFSRGIKVLPKNNEYKPASTEEQSSAPNKIELGFAIDGK